MGGLHILSITLLFVLDVLFTQDGTVIATSILRITGKDEQEEAKNSYLKCEVTDPIVGTDYSLKWYDPNGKFVAFQGQAGSSQRLFASIESSSSISLNVMPVRKRDAGLYTCTAMINGQPFNTNFKITTYKGISFSNCPLKQRIIRGSGQATVLCSASAGGIDLTTFWKRKGKSFQIQSGGNKYAITSAGLVIFNISKTNEMIYEFHAKYDKTFAWEFRSILVKVHIPPDIIEVRNSTGEENGGAVISCKASGDPAPEMKWKPINSDTFYPEGQSGDIYVTLIKDQVKHESTAQLRFTNLKPSHMGDYTCQAHNSAGDDTGYGHLSVRYAAKFSNQPQGPFYNWYGNDKGNVTCVVNGNPLPVVQWFKGGNQIAGQTLYKIQTIEDKDKFQVTSILFAKLDLSNEQELLGDYVCLGLNAAGTNNITIRMLQAEKPSAPVVAVYFYTARAIWFSINVPSVRGPPVTKFRIRFKVEGSNEDRMEFEAPVEWRNYVDDQLVPRAYAILDKLAVKTNYIITVTAVNDVGESAPYEFNQTTRPYSVPQPVVIRSPFPDSTSPTSFLLIWDKPDDGGSEIQKYFLNYREVEIIPNRTQYELSKPLSGFIKVDDIPPSAVSYQLSSLTPGTYYQVEVQAVNTQGTSAPQSYIFKTNEEKPSAPVVSVDYFAARTIRFGITVPSVRAPPVTKFKIKYKVQGANEDPMEMESPVEWRNYVDDRPVPRIYITLENLAVKTNYIITVTAVNDVGESAPYEFTQTTKPYSVPQPVMITSLPDSTSPTSFLLMWDKPDDGGSKIQKYILNYREVEIIPNRTHYELSKPLSGFINVDDIPPSAVRYQMSSLIPGTYYQVEVQAVNTQGTSTPRSYIFKTKEDKPYAPVVFVDYYTARTIQLGITVPSVRGPPVTKFRIRYKVQGSNEDPMEMEAPVEFRKYADDQTVLRTYVTLDNLSVKTSYIITVTAINDVGESVPSEFTQTTRSYSKQRFR